MSNSFYSPEELQALGFAALGEHVLISRHATFYKPAQIFIASHVRIDDFCVISAGQPVIIGNYIHISAHSAIYGAAGFEAEDFVTISGRVAIYTESDDFSGRSLTNPMSPPELKPGYRSAAVHMAAHSAIGTCSTVMPGVRLEQGAVLAAHSLAKESCPAWTIVGGVPAKPIKARDKDVLTLAERYQREEGRS